MGIGALATELLEPRGTGQDDVREPTRGIVGEQIVADAKIGSRKPVCDSLCIGKRRKHVGAKEQKHSDFPLHQRFGDSRHLVGDVTTPRAPLGSDDAGEYLPMRGSSVTGPEPSARDAQVAGEGRETGYRAATLP